MIVCKNSIQFMGRWPTKGVADFQLVKAEFSLFIETGDRLKLDTYRLY